MSYKHKRGKINQSLIKAIVSDPLFKQRIEKAKKGKGSYCRKSKYKEDYNPLLIT